jgi:hypothetical protein
MINIFLKVYVKYYIKLGILHKIRNNKFKIYSLYQSLGKS